MNDSQDRNSLIYILGQIDAKVTHLVSGKTATDEELERHNVRLHALESSYWRIAGLASAIPTFLTVVGLALAYYMGR